MIWLNLHTQTLDSEEFVGSDPIDRATWLCLLRYCIGQENGGVIEDCESWGDRKWQQVVRVTAKEVRRNSSLWSWEGPALTVWGYPSDKESEVRQKRTIASENGKKGGRPKNPKGTDTGTDTGTDEEPTLVISEKAEGKGKERKGIERENTRAPDLDRVEQIVAAYPLQDAPMDCRESVRMALNAGEDPQRMLAAVQACAVLIRLAPGGPSNRFVPTARSFFQREEWRSPEKFQKLSQSKNAHQPNPQPAQGTSGANKPGRYS